MSFVEDINTCEKCSGEFYDVYNCKSNESYGGCNRCGFFREEFLERDEEGKVKQMPEPDNRYIMGYREGGGLGLFNVGGECHLLEDNSEETLKRAKEAYDAYEDGTTGFLTAMIEGELVCLRGTMPQSFEELYGEFLVEESESLPKMHATGNQKATAKVD